MVCCLWQNKYRHSVGVGWSLDCGTNLCTCLVCEVFCRTGITNVIYANNYIANWGLEKNKLMVHMFIATYGEHVQGSFLLHTRIMLEERMCTFWDGTPENIFIDRTKIKKKINQYISHTYTWAKFICFEFQFFHVEPFSSHTSIFVQHVLLVTELKNAYLSPQDACYLT